MLRASALNNSVEVDIQSINGDLSSAETGIEFGPELLGFAEAVARRDSDAIEISRATLEKAAGQKVVIDAAGVAANFQRMVRIADSIGIPVDNMNTELGQSVRQELNLKRFASAQNTLSPQADLCQTGGPT